MKVLSFFGGVIALLAAGALPLWAQGMDMTHEHHMEMQDAKTAAASPYVPGLGDFMAAQQVRHAKLWFAGSTGNWPLAAYEVSELREGFEQVAQFSPTHMGVDIAKLLPTLIAPRLVDLEAAIKEGTVTGFTERFDRLTNGCNECHRAANHSFIVIQRPTAPPFTDQAFAPPKP